MIGYNLGKATFGEQEWYFFSPRDRKYPNGARPNRAATSGYWKATGTDKPILTSKHHKVGVKKALVFYGGKPPKGIKTNWIMHEYRLTDGNPKPELSSAKKASLRLDDWVLCRIYKKNTSNRQREDLIESMITTQHLHHPNEKSSANSSLSVLDNNEEEQHLFVDSTMVSSCSNDHHHHHHHHLPIIKRNDSTLSNNNYQYWISDTNSVSFGSSSLQNKRFHGDLNNGVENSNHNNKKDDDDGDDENNSSFVSLLREIPQNSGFHGNGVIDLSLSDDHHHHNGVLRQAFQLPNMNWNS